MSGCTQPDTSTTIRISLLITLAQGTSKDDEIAVWPYNPQNPMTQHFIGSWGHLAGLCSLSCVFLQTETFPFFPGTQSGFSLSFVLFCFLGAPWSIVWEFLSSSESERGGGCWGLVALGEIQTFNSWMPVSQPAGISWVWKAALVALFKLGAQGEENGRLVVWVGSLHRSSSSLLPFKTIWNQGRNLFSPSTCVTTHILSRDVYKLHRKTKSSVEKARKIFCLHFLCFPLVWLSTRKVSVASLQIFTLALSFSLTTSSCYCEMWLPWVAFPFSPIFPR